MQRMVGDRNLRAVLAASASIQNEIVRLDENFIQVVEMIASGQESDIQTWNSDFNAGVYSYSCKTRQIQSFTNNSTGMTRTTIPEIFSVICDSPKTGSVEKNIYYLDNNAGRMILWWSDTLESGQLIMAGVEIQGIMDRLLAVPLGRENIAIQIYDQDHQLVYETGEKPLSEHELYHQSILSGLAGESGVMYPSSGYGSHVITYAPIQPVGWILVTDEAWEDIATPSLTISQSLPLVLIPLIIIFTLALVFGYKQIVKPLNQLQHQAERLGNGDQNAMAESVGGVHEIQELQTVLMDMSHQLVQSQKNLEEYIGAMTNGIEAERKDLARELHDDSLQELIALKQKVQMKDPQGKRAILDGLQGVIDKLRGYIRGLRPPYLEDLGLVTAIRMLVDDAANQRLTVKFDVHGAERRLAASSELTIYRIVQEGLVNIRKHSNAKKVLIDLTFNEEKVYLDVRDDGVGFVLPDRLDQLAARDRFGLLGIKERVEMIGGDFSIQSIPGYGTSIRVVLM